MPWVIFLSCVSLEHICTYKNVYGYASVSYISLSLCTWGGVRCPEHSRNSTPVYWRFLGYIQPLSLGGIFLSVSVQVVFFLVQWKRKKANAAYFVLWENTGIFTGWSAHYSVSPRLRCPALPLLCWKQLCFTIVCTGGVAMPSPQKSFLCASNADKGETISLTSSPWQLYSIAVQSSDCKDTGTWVLNSNSTTYWLWC